MKVLNGNYLSDLKQFSRFVGIQVRENQNQGLGLGSEACGSQENAEESVSAMEMQELAPLSLGSEHFNTGASAGRYRSSFKSVSSTGGSLQGVSACQSSNQSLASLTVKAPFCSLQQVPDVKLLVEIKSRALALSPRIVQWVPQSLHKDPSQLHGVGMVSRALFWRLLGAGWKGWICCNTTVRKSGVGGITMLFTEYFTLCCSWSFWPLKVQHWCK
uniref:uncharacterized protein C17orf80-like n=1 Tax=Ictidomys tridecemlineatus TaxID=43179 RepID=UPI001A9D57F7|nr:uncharacterized protein C17orf80-like [Ictidomys tridecemlineatus]